MIISRIRTCLALLCLAVSSHANAGATDWMPFTVDDGHILVDITLGGKPVKAILDTGAEHNGISHAFIEHYNPDFVRAGPVPVSKDHSVPISVTGTTRSM